MLVEHNAASVRSTAIFSAYPRLLQHFCQENRTSAKASCEKERCEIIDLSKERLGVSLNIFVRKSFSKVHCAH